MATFDVEITGKVQSGWGNWKRVSEVVRDRKIIAMGQGKGVHDCGKSGNDSLGRDMGSGEIAG